MTTYIDTIFNGLIPAKAIAYDPARRRVVVKITKTVAAYKKGDTTNVMAHDFVVKVKSSGYHIMVKSASVESLPYQNTDL